MTIDWAAWGDEAFARGRAEGKPLLLSLTASWCHACHRMDEETWDDPAVAAAVERATLPVRVDADARPDVYGRYHLGGLPSTALLTPDGDFIRGATFLSRPQLFAFLEAALGDWRSGRRPARRPPAAPRKPAGLVDEVVERLVRRADLEHGGFGSAPKLVPTEALALLLGRWRATRDGGLERIVRGTLDAIVEHLADPRDGGFFRYAAAADWSGPHTEKVAVDQARIARLFLEAGSALAEPRYIEAGRRGLGHARRRLADREGRVFASVAADPEYCARPGSDPPPVDRRRFADAGAAMVGAACLALAVTGESPGFRSEFREAAPDGVVPHQLDAPAGVSGLLRDQALAIEATLMEYRLSGDPELLDWARRAAEQSIRCLWDEHAGAFRAAPAEADGALTLPTIFPLLANGEMALALLGLAAHTGHDEHRRYAERVVGALSPQALASPAGPAVALAAQWLEDKPAEADLHGDPGDPRSGDLARAVIAAIGPATVIRWQGGAEPSLVLCVRDLCLPPLEDPRELLQSLVDLDLAPGGILSFQSSSQRKR
ncbi:MAG: hypothetical protein DMD86_06990 [Candidatus Rokuibacteriota bacterium]|nr:MAG: hypothetical protein DMD86_06990 [Candidatus Rokubacteria bacterium]